MSIDDLRADQLLLNCKAGDVLHLMFSFDLYKPPHLLFRTMKLQVLSHRQIVPGLHNVECTSNDTFPTETVLPTNINFIAFNHNNGAYNFNLYSQKDNGVKVWFDHAYDVSQFNTDTPLDTALAQVDTEVRSLVPQAINKVERIKEVVRQYQQTKKTQRVINQAMRRPIKPTWAGCDWLMPTENTVDSAISEAYGDLHRFSEQQEKRILGKFTKSWFTKITTAIAALFGIRY